MADGVLVSRYRTLKAAGLLRNKEAEEIVEKQIRQGDALKDPIGNDEYWKRAQPIRFEDIKRGSGGSFHLSSTLGHTLPQTEDRPVTTFRVLGHPIRGKAVDWTAAREYFGAWVIWRISDETRDL
jgi:hypothetical protein